MNLLKTAILFCQLLKKKWYFVLHSTEIIHRFVLSMKLWFVRCDKQDQEELSQNCLSLSQIKSKTNS